MERQTHTVDAAGKILGRFATEVCMYLRGKNKPDFQLYKDMGDFVVVKNVNQVKFSGKKFEKKKYYHHTAYLGGLKEISLKKLFAKNPAEVLRKAVYGMLPKNRLRPKQMKRLKFE